MKKSPIDSEIVDLIISHFNLQSFQGEPELMTGEQFMMLVKRAEDVYYKKILKQGDQKWKN
tara:strand:- start:1470 stop:1652 length:183 start_codon:yes stop_codon:yes gene_type:complete